LAEKVIVVTNVWSGPGLAAAILLSRRGFRVFGTVDEYVSTTEELPFTQIRLNRGDVEAVRETVAKLLGVAGGIDALVNISETYTIGALEELSEEQTHQHFADSFFDVLRLTYAVIPSMRARGMGRVVNIISPFGTSPAPFMGMYAASHAALESWSQSLNRELEGTGVHVTAVMRGLIRRLGNEIRLPERPLRRYDEGSAKTLATLASGSERWIGDEILAEVIGRAITDRHPKTVYRTGFELRVFSSALRLAPRLLQLLFKPRF
jgi:NAD(P)-dependent dehydrogenase (short-subunit alcohol dehydrogenase family)